MKQPRQYQLDCIRAVAEAYVRGVRGVVVELATGLGKGFIIAAVSKLVREKGGRVLVTVNRDNLCQQLFESLREQGMHPVMERAQDYASRLSDVVVGSIQTMQGERLRTWRPDHFKLVIGDESHFAGSKTYQEVLGYFPSAYHLGLSATIERHDKEPLWQGYKECVFSMPLMTAIGEGWLVPFEFMELPVPIDISDKQSTKKMWTQKDEDGVFDEGEYLPRMFLEAANAAQGKHGLFFWHGRGPSKEAAKYFSSNGVESRHIDCYLHDSEIEEIKQWFATPGAKACHCSDYFNYGYDNPRIDCIGMMRIRRSVPMMKQNLGRGTRPVVSVDDYETSDERKAAIASSVKPHCTVIDLMLRMGEVSNQFADPTALITGDAKEREWVKSEMRKEGRKFTMAELEQKLKAKRTTDFQKQLIKQAEDAANSAEKAKRKHSGPLYFDHILRRFPHNGKPATQNAVRYLRGLGFDRTIELSAQQCYMITNLYKQRNAVPRGIIHIIRRSSL